MIRAISFLSTKLDSLYPIFEMSYVNDKFLLKNQNNIGQEIIKRQ